MVEAIPPLLLQDLPAWPGELPTALFLRWEVVLAGLFSATVTILAFVTMDLLTGLVVFAACLALMGAVLELRGVEMPVLRRQALAILLVVAAVAGYEIGGWPGTVAGLVWMSLGIGSVYAYYHLMRGMGRQDPRSGPFGHLVGHEAVVIEQVEAGVWVRLDGQEWPARLPPFVPAPPPGSLVRVEAWDGTVLVVRPETPHGG